MTRVIALEPGVARVGFRFAQTPAQALLDGERGVDGLPADAFDAEAFDEIVRALKIVGVFAVILEEKSSGLKCFFGGLDGDEQIGLANFFAGGATNNNLPATFLADETDVLYGGFSAITRTANDTHLQFVRGEQVFETTFEFDASGDGVLHTKAAKVGADTGFDHTHALGVRLAGRHAEISPDIGQIGLQHTQQVDALAASDFDHAHVVFFRNVGNASQFLGRGDAATDAGDYREGAVILNVGVDAIVDEARRAIFQVSAAPDHVHHVTECGLAGGAAGGITVNVEDLLDRTQALGADDFAQLVFAEGQALAQGFLFLLFEFRGNRFEELQAKFGATATTGGRAGAFFELGESREAAIKDGFDDDALGDSVATANDFAMRKLGDAQAGVSRRLGEEEAATFFAKIGFGLEPVHVAMAVGGVADENDAG